MEPQPQIPFLIITSNPKILYKMKKFLVLSIITGILIAGCNPNEDLYDQLDKVTSDAYTDQLEYTLTESDYSDIADLALEDAETVEDSQMIGNIDRYKAFADECKAADYVPAFLGEKYVALDKGSVINVTYNYMGSLEALSLLTQATYYTLTDSDYDSMGEAYGEPGYYDSFDDDVPPDDYLPDFLAGKYPDAGEGDLVGVTYDYYQGEVVEKTGFYSLENGTWQPAGLSVSNIYVLSWSDYDEMGAPGSEGSFSEDHPAADYLPTFLKNKFPYAKKGDYKNIVYEYALDDDNSEMRARKYTFDGEKWLPHKKLSNQFIRGNDQWVFDPTVRFRMSSPDYQMIVDERAAKYVNSFGTAESYSGADSYWGNFSMRIKDRAENEPEFDDMTEEEAFALMWERIINLADEPMETRGALIVLLQKKFPNAVPQQNGVDVFYEVTFDTYYGADKRPVYTVKYRCTASGDPASFEYVESNTPYEE